MTATMRRLAQPTTPTLGGRPMADLSPEAVEARRLKHPPPQHDSIGNSLRAAESMTALGLDFVSSLCGVTPRR